MGMFEILEYRLNRQIQDFVDNPWDMPSLCDVLNWAQCDDVLTYRQIRAARRVIDRHMGTAWFAIWELAPQTRQYQEKIGEDGRRHAGNLWKCWARAMLRLADKECDNV